MKGELVPKLAHNRDELPKALDGLSEDQSRLKGTSKTGQFFRRSRQHFELSNRWLRTRLAEDSPRQSVAACACTRHQVNGR